MTPQARQGILSRLDFERHTIVYPGVTRTVERGVVIDKSTATDEAEIVYCRSTNAEIDGIISAQMERARAEGYRLEWKLYGHDEPPTLGNRLIDAGFEAGDQEMFMVFRADDGVDRFGLPAIDIRRITDRAGLDAYRIVREEVSGESAEAEIARHALLLENHPESMSVYVGYMDGEPASCGRVYWHPDSHFAGLYGGNTRVKFRKRGLYTQIAGVRIRDAHARGVPYVSVDALPTSEPILLKRGFEAVTYTQPYVYRGDYAAGR